MRPLLITLLMICVFSVPAFALSPDQLQSKQAYVIDMDTGQVLLAKNENERMPTSSMSKVMTIYLVFEALEAGRLKMDDTLPVSEKAWRMQGSKMFVSIGSRVRVEDLIRGVIIQSGNDATIVLAEGLAGSEGAFADAMNKKAAELGMTGSHFMNASGWPDPDHYSTAKDLAILAKAFIANFPEHYKIYSEKEYTYNKIKQGNRNPLLYTNVGGDGVKTGHTEEGGYGLIGSGTRNGRRVVMVLNGMPSMPVRADESVRVMEWALGGFDNLSPYANGQKVMDAPVVLGRDGSVPLTVGKTFKVTVPRLQSGDVAMTAEYNEPLVAPLKKGQEVGKLQVSIRGTEPVTLPLVVAEDAPSLGFFSRTFTKALYALTGKGF